MNSVCFYVLVMLSCLICVRWTCRCRFVLACADAASAIVNVLCSCWLFFVVCVAFPFVVANVVDVCFVVLSIVFCCVFTTCIFGCSFFILFFILCYVVVFYCCFLRSCVCLLSCCHMLLNVYVVCDCFCLIAIVVFVDVFLLRFDFRDIVVFVVIDCYGFVCCVLYHYYCLLVLLCLCASINI